jgi:hypothetical protein
MLDGATGRRPAGLPLADRPEGAAMAPVVLVHGFYHVPAHFDAVATYLRAAGRTVVVPELHRGSLRRRSSSHPPPTRKYPRRGGEQGAVRPRPQEVCPRGPPPHARGTPPSGRAEPDDPGIIAEDVRPSLNRSPPPGTRGPLPPRVHEREPLS